MYGPAFAAVAHAANSLAGNERWGEITMSADATSGRHLVSAALALLAALACGLAVGCATGSRTYGLWTAAALLTIPVWTGMGFFNPKDTPAAVGFTFFTVGLALALKPGTRAFKPDRWDAMTCLLVATGLFLAMGTRLALWPPLLASLSVFSVLWILRGRGAAGRNRWGAVTLGLLAGFAALVLLYPAAFTNPLDLVTESIAGSSGYPWTGFTLTAGRLLPENPPWWYLPLWVSASIPILVGAFALFGACRSVLSGWRAFRGASGVQAALDDPRFGVTALALTQMLVLPVASTLVGSTMYTGMRQHLYVVPAIAILAGIGVSYVLGSRALLPPSAPWRAKLATLLAGLALLIPMTEQLLLFPYNYVYVNPVAGLGGVDERWEGDYWWASAREASSRVPEGQAPYCADADPGGRFGPRGLVPCHLRFPFVFEPVSDPDPPAAGGRWVLLRRRAGGGMPTSCRTAGNVTRWLRGETLDISYVARC